MDRNNLSHSAGFRSCVSCILILMAACSTAEQTQVSLKDPGDKPRIRLLAEVLKKSPVKDGIQGLASWYGKRHQHRRTASGERFNMFELTAAHRTLPFGSKLKVRNLSTGREVVVRVNDRGPWSHGRLIDVSYAAGRALGMLRTGVAPVKIELMI